jgi:hypothetical protein
MVDHLLSPIWPPKTIKVPPVLSRKSKPCALLNSSSKIIDFDPSEGKFVILFHHYMLLSNPSRRWNVFYYKTNLKGHELLISNFM